MPTIQIADKPTLDAVKTDTTAILNKSNTTGTAITNLQTSVTNGFNGVNTNLNTNFNSVKTTLGNVNSNVSSIKSDNLINFSSNSQVVRDATYYLNDENIEYTIPSLLANVEGQKFIYNYTSAELHNYNSYSPAINVATHRGKTKYTHKPTLYYKSGNSTIDLEKTNLYMTCLSMPRADDDFIYYADTNYNAYADIFADADIAPTETEYTTFARNGIVYIYMFDGFSWHYAEVTSLNVANFPKVISLAKNHNQLLINIFPTNHNHILFLEARVSSQYNQPRGGNFYYLLYPIEKNGIPIKYEAVNVSASDGDASLRGMAAGIYMPAVFFPSPVGKTNIGAPSGQGQYAWYAVTQTGSYTTSQTTVYPILLNGGTTFTVWGLQSIDRNASKRWTKIKDIDLPASEDRMKYYTQPHMFYNLGCHLTSEPWFFFGHNETAVWLPAILYKLKATNTTVNLDKSILATDDTSSNFFIPFFNVSIGSSVSDSYKRHWLNDLSDNDTFNIDYSGNTSNSFSAYVKGLTMFVNSNGQHIVATENGFIGLDDNGFFALPGDVVTYKSITRHLDSAHNIIANVFQMGYSRYPKTTQHVSFLRDKFYILPQPTYYVENPTKNRTTLIGY